MLVFTMPSWHLSSTSLSLSATTLSATNWSSKSIIGTLAPILLLMTTIPYSRVSGKLKAKLEAILSLPLSIKSTYQLVKDTAKISMLSSGRHRDMQLVSSMQHTVSTWWRKTLSIGGQSWVLSSPSILIFLLLFCPGPWYLSFFKVWSWVDMKDLVLLKTYHSSTSTLSLTTLALLLSSFTCFTFWSRRELLRCSTTRSKPGGE